MKIRSVHGHYSDLFEEEAKRIKKFCKDMYDIDITFTEATAIAAKRSKDIFWSDKKLKEELSRLRGL